MPQRTRTEGPFTSSDTKSLTFQRYGSWTSYSSTSNTCVTSEESSEMTDVVTPEYNQISSAGGIVNNPMTQDKVWIDAPFSEEIALIGQLDGYTEHWSGYFPTRSLFDRYNSVPTVSSTVEQEAINAAYANVSLTKAQALASLGELPETLKTILRLCSGAAFLIKGGIKRHKRNLGLADVHWRKRKKALAILRKTGKRSARAQAARHARLAKKYTKSAANNWLEMRYGLRPLYYEVKQYLEALRSLDLRKPRYTARGYADDTNTVVNTDTYHNDCYPVGNKNWWRSIWPENGPTGFALDVVHTARRQVSARAGVLYEVSPEAYIPALFGLGAGVEAAWELTPFSFIADWFFNIGDNIAALEVDVGCNVLSSWCTVNDELHKSVYGSFEINDDFDYLYLFQSMSIAPVTISGISTSSHVERTVNVSPKPLIQFKPRLDVAKWVDLASLVYTLRKDIRRYTK